jgi:hypothetical protein
LLGFFYGFSLEKGRTQELEEGCFVIAIKLSFRSKVQLGKRKTQKSTKKQS